MAAARLFFELSKHMDDGLMITAYTLEANDHAIIIGGMFLNSCNLMLCFHTFGTTFFAFYDRANDKLIRRRSRASVITAASAA